MGTVGILGLAVLLLSAFLVKSHRDYLAMRFLAESRNDTIFDLRAKIAVLETPKYQVDKPPAQAKEQPKRLVVNSSIARRMMERTNAQHFSADKHIPNSEIVKENANG